jgi:hypothetical protein
MNEAWVTIQEAFERLGIKRNKISRLAKCFQRIVAEDARFSLARQLVRGMFLNSGSALPKGNRCQKTACRVRCDIQVIAASISIRDKKARWNKQRSKSKISAICIMLWQKVAQYP